MVNLLDLTLKFCIITMFVIVDFFTVCFQINVTVFWDVVLHSPIETDQLFRGAYCLQHDGKHLWDVGEFLWNFMAHHLRRWSFPYLMPWEPEISHYFVQNLRVCLWFVYIPDSRCLAPLAVPSDQKLNIDVMEPLYCFMFYKKNFLTEVAYFFGLLLSIISGSALSGTSITFTLQVCVSALLLSIVEN